MTDNAPNIQPPTHPWGCPCAGCEAERDTLARCVAVLVDAGEISADALSAD